MLRGAKSCDITHYRGINLDCCRDCTVRHSGCRKECKEWGRVQDLRKQVAEKRMKDADYINYLVGVRQKVLKKYKKY